MPSRPALLSLLFLLGLSPAALGSDAPLDRYAVVDVAPVTTSIYIGSVSLAAPPFVRKGGVYQSTFTAKVFPFFFYNERGRLEIDVSDTLLRGLENNRPFAFTGRAVRDDGVSRKIDGRVIPSDAVSGRIEVRVPVTRHFTLVFKTTYRLPDAIPPQSR